MFNVKRLLFSTGTLFCVFGCIAPAFNFSAVNGAQLNITKQNDVALVSAVSATLLDSSLDLHNNGKAESNAEIVYTTDVRKNGIAAATNANLTTSFEDKAALVANSALEALTGQDLSSYVIRCTFSTSAASGGCNTASSPYAVTDGSYNTIIGGQNSLLKVASSNVSYNSGTQIFQFDATVQNLMNNALGSINGVNQDVSGVQIFLYNSFVTSGTGSIIASNADGTSQFTAPSQSYFQYNEILAKNHVSNAKTLQFSVPSTVNSFTVEFLISTRSQAKLIVNEVLTNPGGTILDSNGEWFEVYNAGSLAIDLLGFKIGDSGSTGDKPLHTISSSLTIQPGDYLVFGSNANTTSNGGVPVDYAYGLALSFGNIDAVRIVSPFDNTVEIDRVNFSNSAVSGQNGISRELKNPAFDNTDMDGSNWADASVISVYGPGGRGTPKSQNSTFTSASSSISGAVSYGTAPVGESKFVPGVSISAGNTNSTNTNSSGTYLLDNLAARTDYTVTPAKTGNINGITSFDATLVLRCVAAGSSCSLTSNQRLAADANNSNSITSFDATQILRFVAASAQTANTGQVGNWKFNPVLRSYAPLASSLTNENYEAVLIGEVNGSWAP